MSEQFRWWIEGQLTVCSPLRVGDGGTATSRVPAPKDGDPIEVNTVFADADGKAYLPGSTLKGILRSSLSALDPLACQRLFGYQNENEDEGSGGAVEFWDARLVPGGGCAFAPFFDAHRGTAVSAHTAIDRRTRTAAENKLFYFEYVPAGAVFTVRLSANGISSADAGTLLAALALFQHTDTAPRLGASTSDGWGSVAWQPRKVHRMGAEEAGKWLGAPAQPLDRFRSEVPTTDLLALASSHLQTIREWVEFPITIQANSFFLVNDTSHARRQKRATPQDPGNITPLKTPEGAPCLPPSSLRGALRSQAERIYRTMHPEIKLPTISPRGDDDLPRPVHKKHDLKNLDPICQLFGAPGWRSPIQFQGTRTVNPGLPHSQDFVAIDRFTGGGADSLKFDADSYYRPSFRTTLRVDVKALQLAIPDLAAQEEAWLLLGLTLRDLAQGDITIGYGAAKGYGTCNATVDLRAGKAHLPEALQARFATGFRPAEATPAAATLAAPPMSRAQAGPHEFFNPYQFVPVSPATPAGISTADVETGKLGHATHDRYVSGTQSGRIHCTLTAETPIFVGARRDSTAQPARLEHYHLPGNDQPALPASSLRGLISSVAEAASQSALRVLQNPAVYSYRNPAAATGELDRIPTAIGIVVRRLDAGKEPRYYLKPLCLPTYRENQAAPALALYKPFFPQPVLKTYIGQRGDPKPSKDIESAQFEAAIPNWQPGVEGHFRLAPLTWNSAGGISGGGIRLKGPAVLEQSRSQNPQDPRVAGVLRALGCSNRQVAGTKTHELFIRFPEAATFQPDLDELANPKELVTLPAEVITRFERLADEMTDQWREDAEDLRPYEPRGTRPDRRSPNEETRKLRLTPGDLVYFRLEGGIGGTRVAEVSFSSIWRKEISKDAKSPARCHDFFAQITPDLLPLGPQRLKGRSAVPLTAAELLFGFVEDQTTESATTPKPARPAYALAGRLRFSAGIATHAPGRLPEMPLRILSSPKPPSPSMYFARANPDRQVVGHYVCKPELKLSSAFRVRGRKFYLHHAPAFNGGQPWRSNEDAKAAQKVIIQPVDRGSSFHFHLDYDNLSPQELSLLLYSLRPSPSFRHKLGLGKPIGLGSVRIDINHVSAVNRTERYTREDFLASRPRSQSMALPAPHRSQPALECIGSTQVQGVSYPLVNVMRGSGQSRPQEQDQDFGESQHYPWFVATDVGSGSGQNKMSPMHQALEPLLGDQPCLKPLPRLDYRPPRAGA